ncbi:MAG TPA: fasciclin domain-containing protein [Novosphingobium sp.]|nr:fasciclin domain-containing protein [Novosphingobium sp.]
MRRLIIAALASAALVALPGCGKSSTADAPEAASDASSATLAGAISGAAGLSTVASALKGSGLASVFDGAAPYTLLAPTDDAFGALGEAGATLKTPENSAAMAAILRGHILPGYVTMADLDAALDAAKGKAVKMTTMAGDELSFSRDGEELTVTAPDGSSAKVDGKPLTATNGVVIPIDAVLKKVPKTASAG